MGLWGKAAKALVIIVITQIACRHCMPRTPRKSALLNNLNPAKKNPLSTPFPPTRSDKTSKQTFGKTNQNARISKNPFPNESIFKKKHNFPENDIPLDNTPRDPFQLKTNFNNYQANRAKANGLRNTQSSIINEMKKERKMKRKLQSNAQLNNDINQPTKEINPTTFTSGSVNTLLDPQSFPDIQYPLNTMETWEPMYWNSFSLAPPTPFDGLETARSKTTINENIKYPSARMTKTKARQFLKSYDKIKEENKRTSTDNSKRSNAGQSGLNFKKTATSEKASDDFITASLLEKTTKKSSGTNITVESSSGETPNSDTQDICPISDTPINIFGFTKSNRSESTTKTSTNTLKYSKLSLLTEALAAIEDILNSDETNTSVSAENICAIPEEHINTTCYPIMNETTSTGRIDYIEVIENTGNNLQSSTNSSDKATACEELLEAEIDDIPIRVVQSNVSSLLEETNVENFTVVESMLNVETQTPNTGTPVEVVFSDKLNQTPANQAAPSPTSIIIIPINNNAVGPPQSHMIDTTGNAPIIVYIPSTQSNDVPSQTMFGQQNISQVSFNKTVPNNELNNDLSNTAPLLNDNPASTALVSELLDDISNSESSLPMCEPLPINSMCYNNESSQSSIKEKPFLNNATHKSINDMKLFVNSTSNEKSFDDESTDIRDDNINTEKTLPQVLDSGHPIFDFPGSEITSLSYGPYNNIDNELPILPREIDSNHLFVHTPSEQQLVPKDNATLDDHQIYTEDIVPESNLLTHEMPNIYEMDSQTVVPTEPTHISLLPVEESIQSIPSSENLGALVKPADKAIPILASEAHTSIPIELSLSPSPTKNLFDKRIIIDVKLVPIEDTSGDHHRMKTAQDSLPLLPDVPISQSKTDKLSERQDDIDLIVYNELSKTRNNFQEQKYEMLHSFPYLESNLASSYEVGESKPHLVNNLVAPIPNTDPSHGNIEPTRKDMKDLPLRMGILLPDFSELTEDEPISYIVPKIEYSEETTSADISNDFPIKNLEHLALNQYNATLLSQEDMKADDVSDNTSEVLNRPAVIPEDGLIFESIKPIKSDIKIDEVTNKSVTPVGDFVAVKDEIDSMYGKLNDNKLLSPPRTENSLAEAEPSLVNHSPIVVNSELLVNLPLPTDMSSLTSKLLITKALLDNVLADINNTYNTGVLPPSTESIPISIPLANTNTAVEIPSSGPPLNRNQFHKANPLLSSEEVFPNIENDSKKVSLNTLPFVITNLDECNSTDNTTNSFTLFEDMCPIIPTSEFPPSIEQANNETIETEPPHNIEQSVDEIDNISFPKICSDLSPETAVPDRLPLINGPSNHTGDSINIPHADGNLCNSQELVHINDSFSEDFKDTIPILDAPIDHTIREDQADKPNLPSQFNDPISKNIDDISSITVTKDLLESVLLDIFTKRLSLPLTQTNEDTPSVSERTIHYLESTDTFEEDSINSTLLGQLDDTKPTPSVLEKPVLDTPYTDTTNDSLLMQVDKSSSTVLGDDETEILNSLIQEISDEGINSFVIPADQTSPQVFDEKLDTRVYSTSKDHTDESSLSKNKNILTTSSSDSPDYDNEPLKRTTPLSSEITITKELLESVLTDVLRKELLLSRAQNLPDISPLMLTTRSNEKDTSIPNTAIDSSQKENNEATLIASLVDNPADLTDTSFNMSTNQSSIQIDDKIQHQENNLPLVDYIDDEQSKPEKESIYTTNNKAIQLPTTIRIPLQNVLKDITSEGFTLSVVESAASPSTIGPDVPDNIISSTPLSHVDKNFPITHTVDSLDSPIDHEIIEIHEHESTGTQTNDETLPIDEIIISVPRDDIFSPKSPSELRITKALLENVLMDIFTKGLSGLVEKRLHVPFDDDITSKNPTQVLEVSSNTDQSRDNLAFIKETEINLPVAVSHTTVNKTSLKIPIDNSNISTFDKEKENNNENMKTTMPLENDDDEQSSIEDTKLVSNKNIYENDMPSTEKKKYSTSKLTITKALLENLLTDILSKGLSLPEVKPSPITSPSALDKTLYYTETPIPNISNETHLVEVEKIPLDESLVGQINDDSILTENSKDTIPTPGDKAILDTSSIESYTNQNTEVIGKDQNHNNNLALKEYNDDLSPLNEGISEPRTVPVASRSVLDKTLYVVDNTQPNRKQTAPKPIDETFEISTENSNLSREENDSILEQDSEELTQDSTDLDAPSEESYEEEVLENNSDVLSKDAEEMDSLEHISNGLSQKKDIHDVIEEIAGSPALTPKRVLYSKLPSTKALLEKILFDITNGDFLG